MNILTFDTEEWALAKAGGWATAKRYAEYDAFLNRILDVLDERRFQATFFCTGLMASDFPQVVKLIQSRGHEIGCHSYHHTWMNKMTEAEAREDTRAAVDALEQCIGEKVKSYRAPAFSVGNSNKWMFEILAENGIECDASIFPAARDFGGFANFGQKKPCTIEYKGIRIKEFPICMTRVLGKEVAYSGGGFFRFFPLWFVNNRIISSEYSMCYFHLGDLIPETYGFPSKAFYEAYYKEPGTLKNRFMRHLKSNLGKKGAFAKMLSLVQRTDFISLNQAEKTIDWEKAGMVTL